MKQTRADAIASNQGYFEENMPEPFEELPAGLLLNDFRKEIGPVIYNRAIADARIRIQQHVVDLTAGCTRMSSNIGREPIRSGKGGALQCEA